MPAPPSLLTRCASAPTVPFIAADVVGLGVSSVVVATDDPFVR